MLQKHMLHWLNRSATACQCFKHNLCKGTICHPYINVMRVCMCVRDTQCVRACMRFSDRQVISFVGWLIIWLVG